MLTSNYKNIINGVVGSFGSSINITATLKDISGEARTKIESGTGSDSNHYLEIFTEQLLLKDSDYLESTSKFYPDKPYLAQSVMFDSDISDTDYALKTAVGTTSVSNIGGKIGITCANSSASDITINGIQLCWTITSSSFNRKFLVAEWKFPDITIPAGESKTWTVDHSFELEG